MARSPLILGMSGALVLAMVVPVAGSARPAARPSAGKPIASVRVVECHRGPALRDVAFRGTMRRLTGTRRMWMRFQLEERVGDGSPHRVAAPDLGVWRRSRAGVARFHYRQGVMGLAPGSAYRTIVEYRWYGAGRKLMRAARRVSAECAQKGLLPNLRVARIGGKPIDDGSRLVRYAVTVVNRGRASSRPTTVSLQVDGATVDTVEVGALAPGETQRVLANGPRCMTRVEARVDPTNAVRERSEADNTRTVACPSAQ